MVPTIKHPLATSTTYTTDRNGIVLVARSENWGRFDDSGRWLEGELRSADPQMCRFLHSCWRLESATQQTGEQGD